MVRENRVRTFPPRAPGGRSPRCACLEASLVPPAVLATGRTRKLTGRTPRFLCQRALYAFEHPFGTPLGDAGATVCVAVHCADINRGASAVVGSTGSLAGRHAAEHWKWKAEDRLVRRL